MSLTYRYIHILRGSFHLDIKEREKWVKKNVRTPTAAPLFRTKAAVVRLYSL